MKFAPSASLSTASMSSALDSLDLDQKDLIPVQEDYDPLEPQGTNISRNGYSAVGYPRNILRARAAWVAKYAAQVLSDCQADGFAVIGTSGVSMAGAALVAGLKAPILMVRKEDDISNHGSQMETMGADEDQWYVRWKRVVFLDDFIASGNTLQSLARRLAYSSIAVTGVMTYGDYLDGRTDMPLLRRLIRVKARGVDVPHYQVAAPAYYS